MKKQIKPDGKTQFIVKSEEHKIKSIQEELDDVLFLIKENKRLQEKYPERKRELELGLQSLYDLRDEMSDALFKLNYKKAYGENVPKTSAFMVWKINDCKDGIKDIVNQACYSVEEFIPVADEMYNKIMELTEKNKFIQREFMKSQEEWVNSICKTTEENKLLKKELWEAEVNYIEERNDNIIDIEKDMEFLKKEWKNKRWLPI